MKTLLREVTPPIFIRAAVYVKESFAPRPQPPPPPDDDDKSEKGPEFYDETFHANDHWKRHYTGSQYYPFWAVAADRILSDGETPSILDLGCGPGQFAALMRDQGITKYVGVDFSSERIKQAKAVCPGFEFRCEDFFRSDVWRSSWDVVVATEVLEHLDHDVELVSKVAHGTRFIGTVPNFDSAAHVRFFDSEEMVHQRYAPLFSSVSISRIRIRMERCTFLIDGRRS